MTYPKLVKPADVVNTMFGEGLYRIKGGRALYDDVWMVALFIYVGLYLQM